MKPFYFLTKDRDTVLIFANTYNSVDALTDAVADAWALWPYVHVLDRMPPIPIRSLPDESKTSPGQLNLPLPSSEGRDNAPEIRDDA